MTTRKKNEKFKDFYSQSNILIFLWNNFILLFDAKYPGSNNSRVAKTKKKKPVYLSKCGVCGSKKLRFIKKQEACGLLSNLGIKTLLSKIPILGVILF